MNMQAMMQQAQKIQRDIMKKKEEIEKEIFLGKSEWVEVEFNGKKEMLSMKINKQGDISEDDKEILEDMMILAVKDAMKKIDDATEKALGQYSSLNGLI